MFKLAGWPGRITRFAAAMALGIAGPALHTFAKIPLIPYAPFMVISAIALGLEPGDVVVHGRWGEGTVLATSGSGENAEATVQFAGVGRKQLLLRMAPVKRA